MTFETMGLRPELLRGVRDLGFVEPTPIQQEAIPAALDGRDLLACAMTGSGKTAGFILPILHRLLETKPDRPRALIITPTRELAAQVLDDMVGLASGTRLRGAAIFGGVGMRPQERAFARGTDVIVATPGRLLDHLRHPYARLDSIAMLVLDEADRMLDMGFLPDVRRILRHLPAVRQTLLFSATMPPPIAKLAQDMLRDPVSISVGRKSSPADGVRHRAFAVDGAQKSNLLLDVLSGKDVGSVLIFTRTKHRANRLAMFLEKNRRRAEKLHGNRSQSQRQAALDAFKSGRVGILVATDIAARGIDVEDLSHVINFDVPRTYEDYVHRVGRTARAGRTGDAFTFVAPEERAEFHAIEKALGRRIDREPTPDRDGATPAVQPESFDRAPAAPHAQRSPSRRSPRSSRPQHSGRPGPSAGKKPGRRGAERGTRSDRWSRR